MVRMEAIIEVDTLHFRLIEFRLIQCRSNITRVSTRFVQTVNEFWQHI